MTGYFWEPFLQVTFIGPVRQFCKKDKSFMVYTVKKWQNLFLSFSLVYVSLVGSVTIANGQIEWS